MNDTLIRRLLDEKVNMPTEHPNLARMVALMHEAANELTGCADAMHKLTGHNKVLRMALDVCEKQFCAINADWTDPRDNTDKGLRAIAAALEWSAQ